MHISLEEFIKEYLLENEPILLDTRQDIKEWRIYREWIDENGDLNFSKLKSEFGHIIVDVAECSKKEFSDMPKVKSSFKEYLEYIESHLKQRKNDIKYLKDFHFAKSLPNPSLYQPPVYFIEDWLNTYYDIQVPTDDYKFLYLGVDGSWTPIHADVFRSYSWSTNIIGKKIWWLFPPEQENFLKDKYGNYIYDIRKVDETGFPEYHRAKPIVVEQNAGQTIFVPSNWFHQVQNVGLTLSINHNWINSFNLNSMVREFLKESRKVRASLSDLESSGMSRCEWEAICQEVMLKHFGIDLKNMLNFINFAKKQLLDNQEKSFTHNIGVGKYSALLPNLLIKSSKFSNRQVKLHEYQLEMIQSALELLSKDEGLDLILNSSSYHQN